MRELVRRHGADHADHQARQDHERDAMTAGRRCACGERVVARKVFRHSAGARPNAHHPAENRNGPYPIRRFGVWCSVRSPSRASRRSACSSASGWSRVSVAVGLAAVNGSAEHHALEVIEQFSRMRTSLLAITRELDAEELRLVFLRAVPLGDIERQ
jgi:hypothetical protein